jgi:hypothetical protein
VARNLINLPGTWRVKRVTEWAKKEGYIQVGERVVYLLGASWSDSAHTTVMVQEVT